VEELEAVVAALTSRNDALIDENRALEERLVAIEQAPGTSAAGSRNAADLCFRAGVPPGPSDSATMTVVRDEDARPAGRPPRVADSLTI
jgi:hypothetical protein